MKCKKCGIELEKSTLFCPSCGEAVNNNSDVVIDVKPNEEKAVNTPKKDVVEGEASVGWFWLGFFGAWCGEVLGIAAIVWGSILKHKRYPDLGSKLFKGGLIGLISSVVFVIVLVIAIFLIYVLMVCGIVGGAFWISGQQLVLF